MPTQQRSARIAVVGESVEVVSSRNPALKGLSGKAIDETRNTIKIRAKEGIKTIIKEQVTVRIRNSLIEGKKLSGRIEERIKNSI